MVAALWLQLIAALVGLGFVIAYFATGRRNQTYARIGAGCVMLMSLIMFVRIL
jgi:hypothetical protein